MKHEVRTIYLDNSHLHLLSELRRTNAARFASFLKIWTTHRCVLVLSQAHLSEISRYEDEIRREARFDFLETLMPIRSDLPIGDGTPQLFLSLTNREIFNALVNRGVISLKDPTLAHLAYAFPNTLSSRNDIDLLKGLSTIPVYRDLLNAFYQASETAALANTRPLNTKYEMHRLSEIPTIGLDPDVLSEIMRRLDEAQISASSLDGLANLVSEGELEGIFNAVKDMIKTFGQRTVEIGGSNALAEYLGADPTDRSNLDDLIVQHTFDFSVRQFLVELCGDQDGETISNLSRKVKLADCPGTWLKHAVRVQMRKAMPTDHASNYYDLEHLSYLPYVDKLFADKRVANCAAQVLNSKQVPSSIKSIRAPIAIANSVDALEAEILLH